MKRQKLILVVCASFIGLGLLFTRCSKEEKIPQQDVQQNDYSMFQMEPNPDPADIEIPAATVPLMEYESTPYFKDGDESYLMPAELTATLAAGESVMETKTGFISGAPAKGDILFCLDLTGSMGGELSNAKINSINIMNAIRGIIPDTYFGSISHMDYPGYYSGCGYSSTYGASTPWPPYYVADYAYQLGQDLTATTTDVETSINGLDLGQGSDGPESYSRALYETYSDPNINWRDGSKKFVIAWLDNIPHDCDVYEIISDAYPYAAGISRGPDPGRDGIANNEDDLAILDVLQGMADNDITLIVLYSGGAGLDFELWSAYAEMTGGLAVLTNYDGTIPYGADISTYISGLILDEISNIDEITLGVCTTDPDVDYDAWLTEVVPPMYGPVDLDSPWDGTFDITVTVPEGTEDGDYFFDICLLGDGAEYGRQNVHITVQSVIEVPFDVHPTSCPNPINRNGGGVIPMAILGTEDFDVTMIDPATLEVLGVNPVLWSFEDVATPYEPYIGKEPDKMSCNTYEGDGFEDLTLKFNKAELAAMLESYEVGDVVVLTITGQLLDGTDIVGEDVIWIIK